MSKIDSLLDFNEDSYPKKDINDLNSYNIFKTSFLKKLKKFDNKTTKALNNIIKTLQSIDYFYEKRRIIIENKKELTKELTLNYNNEDIYNVSLQYIFPKVISDVVSNYTIEYFYVYNNSVYFNNLITDKYDVITNDCHVSLSNIYMNYKHKTITLPKIVPYIYHKNFSRSFIAFDDPNLYIYVKIVSYENSRIIFSYIFIVNIYTDTIKSINLKDKHIMNICDPEIEYHDIDMIHAYKNKLYVAQLNNFNLYEVDLKDLKKSKVLKFNPCGLSSSNYKSYFYENYVYYYVADEKTNILNVYIYDIINNESKFHHAINLISEELNERFEMVNMHLYTEYDAFIVKHNLAHIIYRISLLYRAEYYLVVYNLRESCIISSGRFIENDALKKLSEYDHFLNLTYNPLFKCYYGETLDTKKTDSYYTVKFRLSRQVC